MVALLWIFQELLAVAGRPLVPQAAAGLGRRLQPRPRRQRRAEDDGDHRRRALRRRLHPTFKIDLWVILMAHAAIALGTLSGGWRIIHTMGSKITKLQPVGGFAAETAGAISLFTATHLGDPGQHHAHDHRRDHRRRLDPAPLGRPLGRRRPHRLGLAPDDPAAAVISAVTTGSSPTRSRLDLFAATPRVRQESRLRQVLTPAFESRERNVRVDCET